MSEYAKRRYGMTYLDMLPAALPADGRVLVHNVLPTRRGKRGFQPIGSDGFRAWLAEPSARLARCACGWAAELGTHYRVRRA